MPKTPRSFPSFASLRAFEAVARLGQVTRAAEELSLTQSAVSHRLKDLEGYLGISLFSRNRNGSVLTDAGRIISINLSGIFNQLDMLLRNAAPSLPQHKLTVSVHPAFGSLWLAPRLESLFALHPELRLDLRSTQELASFGGNDGVDLAIRYGPGGWSGLHSTKLLDDRLILACSSRFNAGNIPRSPQQLAGMKLIRDSHDSPLEWFAGAGEQMPAVHEIVVDDPALIVSAVMNRAGVALVRETLVADALRAGVLVSLFGQDMATRYGYYCVCPLARSFEPKIATFRGWLSDMASRTVALPGQGAGLPAIDEPFPSTRPDASSHR